LDISRRFSLSPVATTLAAGSPLLASGARVDALDVLMVAK
jgi:hypothetical protein